jgi:hypothetical protein
MECMMATNVQDILDENENCTGIAVTMPTSLYNGFDDVVRQGLLRIQETLAGLRDLENSMPMYPEPSDKIVEPRLEGLPMTREAIYKVIMYYQDLEKNALALLQIKQDEKDKRIRVV